MNPRNEIYHFCTNLDEVFCDYASDSFLFNCYETCSMSNKEPMNFHVAILIKIILELMILNKKTWE